MHFDVKNRHLKQGHSHLGVSSKGSICKSSKLLSENRTLRKQRLKQMRTLSLYKQRLGETDPKSNHDELIRENVLLKRELEKVNRMEQIPSMSAPKNDTVDNLTLDLTQHNCDDELSKQADDLQATLTKVKDLNETLANLNSKLNAIRTENNQFRNQIQTYGSKIHLCEEQINAFQGPVKLDRIRFFQRREKEHALKHGYHNIPVNHLANRGLFSSHGDGYDVVD